MIIKLTKHGKGDIRKAIQYVLQEKNNKGEKRDQIELVYGNPDELIAIANSTGFKNKVKKLKYFSGVLALAEGERLTQEQIQTLVTQFGKTLNNGGQTDIPFVVVRHVEGGKEHYHFVGLRYDLNTRSFSNPFRPRWERKWIPWVKQMEHYLGLRKVERKRDWIEQTYYHLQLLCSRNPRLYKHFELWFKVLELAFIIKNFRLLLEVDDERLKRVLSKANRPYPEFCNATDPKEIGWLVQREIERDRKHNEKYRTDKANVNNEYVIERIDHYPTLDNDIKEMKGEVKMEKTQNAKEELELFKKEIDLVEFFVANGGKVLERSSSNSYRIEWNGEKFLTSRNENGHWLFQGIDDESKRGSIIDLCNLMGLKNLGEIRKKLRLYLNYSKPKEEKTIQTQKKEVEVEVKEVNWKEKVRLLSLNEVVNHEVWKERGIDPHQLDMFLKNVYTDERGNLCFPIVDQNGITIGYEVKGRKGFKMNLGSKQGLTLIGENTLLNEKLVITESVYDALAYEQLMRPQPKRFYDCLYVSTSGQLTERQMEQIRNMVIHKRVGALKEVIIAFDNDEQGRKYAEKLKECFKDLGIKIVEHYSQEKDWNDELKKQKQQKGEIKWQKGEKKGLRLVR